MGVHWRRFNPVSVVVRRMYYWDSYRRGKWIIRKSVSVVVRRMYYWDCEQ